MATTMHVSDVAELLSEGRTHFNLSPAVLVEHSDPAQRGETGSQRGYRRIHQSHRPVSQRQVHREG